LRENVISLRLTCPITSKDKVSRCSYNVFVFFAPNPISLYEDQKIKAALLVGVDGNVLGRYAVGKASKVFDERCKEERRGDTSSRYGELSFHSHNHN
jgi:hypothetical protein